MTQESQQSGFEQSLEDVMLFEDTRVVADERRKAELRAHDHHYERIWETNDIISRTDTQFKECFRLLYEDDMRYANVAPSMTFGMGWERLGTVLKPESSEHLKHLYHTITVDARQSAKAIVAAEIALLQRYGDHLHEYHGIDFGVLGPQEDHTLNLHVRRLMSAYAWDLGRAVDSLHKVYKSEFDIASRDTQVRRAVQNGLKSHADKDLACIGSDLKASFVDASDAQYLNEIRNEGTHMNLEYHVLANIGGYQLRRNTHQEQQGQYLLDFTKATYRHTLTHIHESLCALKQASKRRARQER